MRWETFTRLIDEFDGLKTLHLQGLGEPMMHPRFFDMVEYAAARGVRVTTNTNFSLLNDKRVERLVRCGLHTLHVSVDGATPGMYERIRERGHYDRLVRNLELLDAAQAHAGTTLPHRHLVMVIMRQNLHELPDVVRFAHRWSMEEMFVQHLAHDFQESSLPEKYAPMRDYVDEQTLLNEDSARIEHYFDQARAVARSLGLRLRLPKPRAQAFPPHTPGRKRCSWPWTGAYVSFDGLAMPCCMIATPDRMNLGSMADEGVKAIWNSGAYEDFRKRLDSSEPPEICNRCSVYHQTF
jgi:radical SAM protein with 4Fe4S-binding SPASM domain